MANRIASLPIDVHNLMCVSEEAQHVSARNWPTEGDFRSFQATQNSRFWFLVSDVGPHGVGVTRCRDAHEMG